MQKVITFAAARTGSTFLHGHFATIPNYSYNSMEFFNAWVPGLYGKVDEIYIKNNLPIPPIFQRYFDKSFRRIMNRLWTRESAFKNNKDREKWMGEVSPYQYNMLEVFANTLEQLNHQYFFSKIIFQSVCKSEWLPQIIKYSDKIILNYRSSLIDNYISIRRASLHNIWNINKNTSQNSYDPKYDNDKIIWDQEEFVGRCNAYDDYYKNLLNEINKQNAKYQTLCYEELCETSDKQKYLSDKLNIDTKAITETPFIKQSQKLKKHSDAFSNPEQFITEYNMLDSKFTEDYHI